MVPNCDILLKYSDRIWTRDHKSKPMRVFNSKLFWVLSNISSQVQVRVISSLDSKLKKTGLKKTWIFLCFFEFSDFESSCALAYIKVQVVCLIH